MPRSGPEDLPESIRRQEHMDALDVSEHEQSQLQLTSPQVTYPPFMQEFVQVIKGIV